MKKRGFDTTLISGPTNLSPINGINNINVKSAKEMFDATLNSLPVDVAIFSAAVADWKILKKSNNKIKKNEIPELKLEKNIDILKHVSNHNSLRPKLVIGFSAESENVEQNSQKKLQEKNCDWIIANDISNPSIGFDSDFNEVDIFYNNEKKEKIPKLEKQVLADKIVDKIVSKLN